MNLMHHHDSWIPRGRRITARVLSWLAFAVVAGGGLSGHAQWLTQSTLLTNGWNSVYLHVDASHTNLSSLLKPADPIDEIWLWTSALPPGLSVATPPDETSSQWVKWTKAQANESVLQTLPANAALLVKVSASKFTWNIKGSPVAPNYRWTLTGLNFIGFPTASPAPKFDKFLAADAQSLNWIQNGEIFRYQGGTPGPPNPVLVSGSLQRSIPVVREQAYWARACELTNQLYNHYFGPFQVTGGGSSGLRFGDSQGQARLYLKNMTPADLTVTMREVASEASPTGAMPTLLPMIVRGSLVVSNITFSYSSLTGPTSTNWAVTLKPNGQTGSEVEIVLGVDRAQMSAQGGPDFAGVLRFTDSLGLTRVDIGASATTSSRAGLWVGNAVVDQVSEYLKPYVKATNAYHFHQRLNELNLAQGTNNPTGTNVLSWATSADHKLRFEWITNTSLILVFGTNANGKVSTGSYLLKGPIQTNLASVAPGHPMPLRLIVHSDGTTYRLMQQAYLGRDSTSNLVVATKQSFLLAADLANARRVSAVHLPTMDGLSPWSGTIGGGGSLRFQVDFPWWDQESNPFLHTYHPDHDNLNALYTEELPAGRESYGIRREMNLLFTGAEDDFDSRTRGGTSLSGNYAETVSVLGDSNVVLKEFNVLGTFALTRVTDTANFKQ